MFGGIHMTVKDIELTVQNIARLGNYDPEMAHKSQDDLFVHVLKEIAHDNPHSKEMAREVLKIIDIDFPRWYA